MKNLLILLATVFLFSCSVNRHSSWHYNDDVYWRSAQRLNTTLIYNHQPTLIIAPNYVYSPFSRGFYDPFWLSNMHFRPLYATSFYWGHVDFYSLYPYSWYGPMYYSWYGPMYHPYHPWYSPVYQSYHPRNNSWYGYQQHTSQFNQKTANTRYMHRNSTGTSISTKNTPSPTRNSINNSKPYQRDPSISYPKLNDRSTTFNPKPTEPRQTEPTPVNTPPSRNYNTTVQPRNERNVSAPSKPVEPNSGKISTTRHMPQPTQPANKTVYPNTPTPQSRKLPN